MTVRLERDGDNITQTELSACVARDTSTLLRLIDQLEARGIDDAALEASLGVLRHLLRFAGYTAVGACIAGTIISILVGIGIGAW